MSVVDTWGDTSANCPRFKVKGVAVPYDKGICSAVLDPPSPLAEFHRGQAENGCCPLKRRGSQVHCLCSYYAQSLNKEVDMQSGWNIIATYAENELQVEDALVGPQNKLRVCAVLMYAVKCTHIHWFVCSERMFDALTNTQCLVGIFITAPFGKHPLSLLLFCWFLCLLSPVFFSMRVVLRLNALLVVYLLLCMVVWI